MATKVKNQKHKRHLTNRHKKPSHSSRDQTFADHIAELRRRFFIIALAFIAGSALAYHLRHQLLTIIMAPLHGQKLVYLTPGGGFSFIFQIVLAAGLILSAPVIVYQFHEFIRPALPDAARKSVIKVTLFSLLLICGGVSYGYVVAIPAAITFLSTFAEGTVTPNLTADSYLSFFLAYIGGLAVLSLIPLVVIFWHWIKPITPSGLFRGEQWVILIAFILAAVITPTPDVVNQSMIAAPIIAVYQLGVLSVLISIFRTKHATKRAVARSLPSARIQPIMQRRPAVSVEASPRIATPVSTPVAMYSPSTVPTTAVSVQATRRPSIDGFRSHTNTTSVQRPASRLALQLPERQYTQASSSHPARRKLSVDGFM